MSGQLTTTIDSPKTSSEKQPSPSTITDFAKDMDRTDEGVITVMQKGEKFIGELPIPLRQNFLMVSRVAGVPNGYFGFTQLGPRQQNEYYSSARCMIAF